MRPIPKRARPVEIEHFRPITILCAASKLLEAMAYKQISDYVDANDLLDPLQSGFRRRHGTHTALIKIADDIREAIDNEKVVLMAGIDFSRGFELVNVGLLVEKLEAYGFSDSACCWVRSFLTGRSQIVAAPCGEISAPIERNVGVPQGSLNGPPFFSLFANDAPSVLRFCQHHLYADDLTIYHCGLVRDLQGTVERVNRDLHTLSEWAESNGLVINAAKTQAVWFGSRGFMSRMRSIDLPKLVLSDVQIYYKDSIKLLGVELDSTLTWSTQCTATAKK